MKMSFLKRLGKSKTAEFPDGGDEKPKSQKSRRGGSLYLRRSSPREEDQNAENGGEVLRTVEEEKEKEKERKKYKDMSGILVGQHESVEYPNFEVHYLGRIPTSTEYGREAVEEPVNQLCKLREKQKLQRVHLSFNVEGLFCRGISGPFSKIKKDGFNMHIPLHHITYGVGCTAHPTVFACVAKMNDDPNPANQVLVLHAFVCDKPETTQAITYWQLQAYIEAYEDLKRKRILRSRRKHAIEASASLPPSQSQRSTDIPRTVPEEEGRSKSSTKSSSKSEKSVTNNNVQPKMVGKPVPKEATSQATKTAAASTATSPQATKTAVASATTPPATKTAVASATTPPATKTAVASATTPPATKTAAASATKTEPDRPQLPRLQLHSGKSRPEARPMADQQQATVDIHPDHSHPSISLQTPEPESTQIADHKRHQMRKSSGHSTGSGASSSGSSGHGGDASPLFSPASEKSNKTFETRIGELNTLVNMDAEKLKMLMINEHPTLARRIYYRATVDESGVFHQGDDEEEDSHA